LVSERDNFECFSFILFPLLIINFLVIFFYYYILLYFVFYLYFHFYYSFSFLLISWLLPLFLNVQISILVLFVQVKECPIQFNPKQGYFRSTVSQRDTSSDPTCRNPSLKHWLCSTNHWLWYSRIHQMRNPNFISLSKFENQTQNYQRTSWTFMCFFSRNHQAYNNTWISFLFSNKKSNRSVPHINHNTKSFYNNNIGS